MPAERCDLLADRDRVRHVLGGLITEPALDRDAVVAHDHERIMQITNDARHFRLEYGVQAFEDLGIRCRTRLRCCAGHGRSPFVL